MLVHLNASLLTIFFVRDEPKNIDTGMQEYCSNSGNGDDSSLGSDSETDSCINKSKLVTN